MHLGTEGFQEHARQALKDEPLQKALHLLTNEFVPRRVAAMQALGDPEALRTQARAVKERAIARLDTYLEQFADNLDRLGARVHWAHDAAEARDIITGIAQQAGAKVIVKGKSMAAEEIHLNPHLEELGYEVLETDLGEYIIQLAEETPSHIIAPAIHKTRQQIAIAAARQARRPVHGRTARHDADRPSGAAPAIPARRRGHHRRQLRHRRYRLDRAGDQRGQRAAVVHPAARAHCADGHGKDHPAARRPAGDAEGADQQRHRPEDIQLRHHDYRTAAGARS